MFFRGRMVAEALSPSKDGCFILHVYILCFLCVCPDFRLQVRVFYQGLMVDEVLSPSQDGCFILHGAAPVGNERIYGPCAAERLFFPPVDAYSLAPSIADAMHRLLPHLERGVLVWVAPDGVFIKRFCQGRVYWGGPMAEHRDQPNKLERERTCKLLDMPIFLQGQWVHTVQNVVLTQHRSQNIIWFPL